MAGDPLADIEREDDLEGYEAEDAAFWRIVSAAQEDACGICGFWRCRCGTGGAASVSAAAVLMPVSADGQCSVCGGWFDSWNGGVCDACRSVGRCLVPGRTQNGDCGHEPQPEPEESPNGESPGSGE